MFPSVNAGLQFIAAVRFMETNQLAWARGCSVEVGEGTTHFVNLDSDVGVGDVLAFVTVFDTELVSSVSVTDLGGGRFQIDNFSFGTPGFSVTFCRMNNAEVYRTDVVPPDPPSDIVFVVAAIHFRDSEAGSPIALASGVVDISVSSLVYTVELETSLDPEFLLVYGVMISGPPAYIRVLRISGTVYEVSARTKEGSAVGGAMAVVFNARSSPV